MLEYDSPDNYSFVVKVVKSDGDGILVRCTDEGTRRGVLGRGAPCRMLAVCLRRLECVAFRPQPMHLRPKCGLRLLRLPLRPAVAQSKLSRVGWYLLGGESRLNGRGGRCGRGGR